MISTNTPDRIDGKDYLEDRWAAHTAPPVPQLGIPALVTIRALDGTIQLTASDALALGVWLRNALRQPAGQH